MLTGAVTLQHEAYRDGVVSAADLQFLETFNAAKSHTDMAMRMREDYGNGLFSSNNNLLRDINELTKGDIASFAKYVGANYDSSADYWKLYKDGTLEFDGDGWLKDEKGNFITKNGKTLTSAEANALINSSDTGVLVGAKGIEGGLTAIFNQAGLGIENTALYMKSSGFSADKSKNDYNEADTTTWYWNAGENTNKSISLGMDMFKALTGKRGLNETQKTLINTNLSVTSEFGRMEWELGKNGFNKAETDAYLKEVKLNFQSLGQIGSHTNAGGMLADLRSGLKAMKGNTTFDMNSHILLNFADRVFRGGASGNLGLSQTMKTYYTTQGGASTGILGFLGIGPKSYQSYGIGSAAEFGARMTVAQIAETFTGDYMNIDYGQIKNGNEAPSGVYYGNYYSSDTISYGQNMTYHRNGSSTIPYLDCSGFAGLVYHAAGLLGYGEKMNQPGDGDGVINTFNSGYITPTSTPKLGDFIFMEYGSGERHIGIMGIDDSGNYTMIHSAPDPAGIRDKNGQLIPFWNELGHMESGPRINKLPSNMNLIQNNRYNDRYIDKLIEINMFGTYKLKHNNNFGSWYAY